MADEQRSVRRSRFKDSPFSDSSTGTLLPGGKSASALLFLPLPLVLLAPGRGQLSFSHAGPPAVVPRGGPTPTVNLHCLLCSDRYRLVLVLPSLVFAYLSPPFARRATYWRRRYLESSADHQLQSRDWLRELSTTVAPSEAWRCCEDRLASRVGESVRKLRTATGLSFALVPHTPRHGREPQ